MQEYELIFIEKLRERLNGEVKRTKISIKVTKRDKLYVRFNTFDNLTYEYEKSNLSENICCGLTTEYLAYDIIKNFKKFVLSSYFD